MSQIHQEYKVQKEEREALFKFINELSSEESEQIIHTMTSLDEISDCVRFSKFLNEEYGFNRNIVHELYHFVNEAVDNSEGINKDTFKTTFFEYIKNTSDKKFLIKIDLEKIYLFLEKIIYHENTEIMHKAENISHGAQNVYVDDTAQIFSDFRPIFKKNMEEDILFGSLIHNLKFDYISETDRKDFYLALSKIDLIQLREVIDRAIMKDKKIREFAHKNNPKLKIIN